MPERLAAEFRQVLSEVAWHASTIPLVSTLTGGIADEDIATADYWQRQFTEPVRFSQGMEALAPLADGFLEIGPQPLLIEMGRQVLPDREACAWLPTLSGNSDEWTSLLDSLAQIAQRTFEFNWAAFDRDYARRRLSLPTYPFQRQRHWIDRPRRESTASRAQVAVPSAGRPPLLQQRWQSPVVKETVFETRLSPRELPYLADHRFLGMAIMPATGYVAMALSAARELFGAAGTSLHQVSFSEILPLTAELDSRVQLIVSPTESGRSAFQLISLPEGESTAPSYRVHARGELGASLDLAERSIELPASEELRDRYVWRSQDEFYAAIREHDVEMRDLFQVVEECWTDGREFWGRVRIPQGLDDMAAYAVHPSILDSCLQLLPGGSHYDSEQTMLPVGIEGLTVLRSTHDRSLWCRSLLRNPMAAGDKRVTADAWLLDDSGEICVALVGVQYQVVSKSALRQRLHPVSTDTLFETVWRPQPLANVSDESPSGRWLILGDRTGLGERLASALTQAGHECVLALAGDAFHPTGPQRYRIAADSRVDWERLLHDTVGVAPRPFDGVLYLWGLDCARPDQSPEDVLGDTRQACHGLANCAHALLVGGGSLPPITLVTRGSQAARRGELAGNCAAATLWGFGRALEREHPEWTCRRIDMDVEEHEREIDELLADILQPDAELDVAYRGRERLVARLDRLRRDEARGPVIRADRTYLITGGQGALGMKTAEWLIDQGARHLVLASRTPDSKSISAQLANWGQRGVEIACCACDMAQSDDVARMLKDLDAGLPPLAGVIHAAGVLEDGAIERLDWPQFERVLEGKAYGAWHLHRLTESRPLDFLICYSSIASNLGSAGQANYCAANSFLDALAAWRQARGLRTLSVQWGPWKNGGMAARLSESVRQRHAQRGWEPIDDETAFAALADLLPGDVSVAMVAAVDWTKYRRELPADNPFLELLAPAAIQTPSEESSFRKRWEAAADYERRDLVAALTQRLMRQASGFEEIGGDDSFFDFGLDSLSSVQFRNDLQDQLGCELPTTLVFQYPTLNQLNAYLLETVLSLDEDQPPVPPARDVEAGHRHNGLVHGNGSALNGSAADVIESGQNDLSVEDLAEQLAQSLADLQREGAS